MASDTHDISSRYQGALLGAAVADALAFPFRNYSRHFLLSIARPMTWEYESPPGGFHPRGQYTAETQSWVALVDSILEREDFRDDAESAALFVDYMIPLWRDELVIQADDEVAGVFRQIVKGIKPWDQASLPAGYACGGAISRAIPIGLWNCRSIGEIPRQVETIIGVSHEDRRVLAVSAALAAAVANNASSSELILGRLLDRVSQAASVFDEDVAEAVLDMPRFLSQAENRALEMIERVALDDDYLPRNDGLQDYAVPILLAAIYEFLKMPHDYSRAVDRSLRVGGHNATTACLTGALVGSFNGVECISASLLEDLVEQDEISRRAEELFALRRRLVRESWTGSQSDSQSDSRDDSRDDSREDANEAETPPRE